MRSLHLSEDQRIPTERAAIVAGATTRRVGVVWSNLVVLTGVHAAALLALHPATWTLQGLGAFLVLYFATGVLGIELGVHRLLSHRSFRVVKPVEYLLSWLCSLTLQGGPITWAAVHRSHHLRADTPLDLHSPRQGLFWSHAGWLLDHHTRRARLAARTKHGRDLLVDPVHVAIEALSIPSQFAIGAACYCAGGWPCVIWGVFVRLVATYHVVWATNSASHRWGYKRFPTGDDSRNLWWVALLTCGEWHNNHHAFPRSARMGIGQWELDPCWHIIRLMEVAGLAWDVYRPGSDHGGGSSRRAARHGGDARAHLKIVNDNVPTGS